MVISLKAPKHAKGHIKYLRKEKNLISKNKRFVCLVYRN